ncbi:MAG: TonB-dependent receptor [Oleispira sp.]|nr:TonB-dependent receptor [Oleispira sp.]
MKKLILLIALLPLSSFAELELETQKVTSSKITENQLSNSTIINKEEIKLLQASNLSEILTSLPGFQVTQQGGNAHTQSFVMNGYRSDQVLILLNGQRFGSATLGQTTYNTIPANIIQRIEIVSNARSAIYGSDALGGVINIVTTQGDTQSNNVRIALGNQNTSQFSTDLNKSFGDLSLHLSGFTEKTQGYDVLEINDPDNDGSERHTLGLDARYKINDNNTLSASNQNNRGSVDYDGLTGAGRERDYQQQVSSIGWQYSDDKYGVSANYGESDDKSWDYGNGTSRSDADAFITKSKIIDISARVKVTNSQSLLLVSDYREDDIGQSDAEYTETKSRVNGLGLSHNYSSNNINTELGIRRDDSTNFDENHSYSASAEWFIIQELSLTAAVNTGFKAPSFNDLYYPLADYGEWGTYEGNEDLTPEKSLNRRISLKYDNHQSRYEISYQHSNIDDLIQWQDIGGGENKPVNVDQVLLRNMTVAWNQNWSNFFTSQLSYEWNHSVDLETHNLLQRQSARVTKLNLNYVENIFSFGSSIRHLSESYDDAENNDLLAAYTVIDAYGNITVASNFTIGLRLNNLANKEYETAKGYPAQERTYLVNGTFTF